MKTGDSTASGDFDQLNTTGFELARGDTDVRDGLSPELGMIRYNTDINRPETYTNQGWKKLLIDSDLGSGSVEDAIGAKLRAAKKMDTMTIVFQQGAGCPGAPRISTSTGTGTPPGWLSSVDNGPTVTVRTQTSRWTYTDNIYRVRANFWSNQSASRGNNYFFYKLVPENPALYTYTTNWRYRSTNTGLKSVYYGGNFTVDIFKMLDLPGSRWDYVYNVFGGVSVISGQINAGFDIINDTSWWNKHAVSPDLTDTNDTDQDYGKVVLSMRHGCAGKWDHSAGYSFYFSGRKFKNF